MARPPVLRRDRPPGPGEYLPTTAPPSLVPYLNEFIRHVHREVVAVAPEYAFDGSGLQGVIAAATRYAVSLMRIEEQDPVPGWSGPGPRRMSTTEHVSRLFRGLGRQEYLLGRSLERLHSAYCTGGRAAWQFLAARFGEHDEFSRAELCSAADAVFATVEYLSELSAEGFAAAKDETAGHRDRARTRLLALILADPPPSAQAIRTLAEQAGWAVPERVAVVVLEPSGENDTVPLLLEPEILRDLDADPPCLLAPARREYRDDLTGQLRGRRAAIGPPVPVTAARESLLVARRAAELRRAGVLPDEDVLQCVEHITDMLLLADPLLLGQLIGHSLSELRDAAPQQQDRLAETLFAWLSRHGNTAEVAEDLGVHPQTVRYRMGQLRELFGARLDDSAARTAMLLALHGRRLRGVADGHG